ncbi:MAG: DVU0524 family FlgM-associated protein [Thermodesulfobacteriota bacterium]
MEIPTYQIHRVMKVYTKQLTQSKMMEKQKALGAKPSMDRINISAEGKRKAIIDKVASDVVERITNFGPRDEFDQELIDQLEQEIGQKVQFQKSGNAQFVFNVIDANNEKKTTSLSVEGSEFLVKRLEQLAKEAVDKNMEA